MYQLSSTKIDEFVQTQFPQVVVFFKERSWNHVQHALASEYFCLYVPEEDFPKEGEDDEGKQDEEHDAQLYEQYALAEKFGEHAGQRIVKTVHLTLIVGVGDD